MECKLEQGTIHYETYGDGRPMLVLHGGYLDHRHMVSVMEPLFDQRAGWQRIYPDLPGHGGSKVADSVSSHDHVLDVIQDFMHEICPSKVMWWPANLEGATWPVDWSIRIRK